jgi:predicted dehydrogenase
MNSNQPLRVGLVGYGFAGKTFHAPLIAATPGLALAAIASSDPAKVHADWPAVQLFSTPEALCAAELDLVVVATPNTSHHPIALAALLAGKHVVVDKPFTVDVAEGEELAALAAERNRVLSVFHNRRWDSDFRTLQRLIADGVLGDVVCFESHFDRYRPLVRERWRELPGPGSGVWYDLGSHLLDQALTLFGAPQSLWADIFPQRADARTDDYFHAVLRYGALRVVLHASSLAPAEAPRFVVQGTLGGFVSYGLDPQEDALKAGTRPGSPGWGVDPRPGELTTWDETGPTTRLAPSLPGDYGAFYAAVRDAVHGHGPNPVPPEQALAVMRLLALARS